MIHNPNYLSEQEKKHKAGFLRNLLVQGFCTLAGFTLLIPAFTQEGSKLDYREWCFKPSWIPPSETYCTGDRRKRGIEWRVALETHRNPEFREKVTFLQRVPADNPDSGYYGMVSAILFLSAWGFSKLNTDSISSSLDILIHNYRLDIIKREMLAVRDLELTALANEHIKIQTSKGLENHHNEVMEQLCTVDEIAHAQVQGIQQAEMQILGLEHDKAAIKAQTAKHMQTEAEALLARQKAQKKLDDPWDDSDSPKGKVPKTKEELIHLLKEHEDGWLYELSISPLPLWVLGSMGSWKSNFAATLALCRQIVSGWKIHSITDPDLHQNKKEDKAWHLLIDLEPELYGISPEGEGYYWEGVEQSINEAFTRWSVRSEDDPRIQSIWDEVTKYGSKDDEGKLFVPSASQFMLRVYSDTRKSHEVPIFLGHSFTNETTQGKGGKQLREEGSIRVWLGRNNQQKPTFKGRIEGWVDDNGNPLEEKLITIPVKWFNQKTIKEILTNGTKIQNSVL